MKYQSEQRRKQRARRLDTTQVVPEDGIDTTQPEDDGNSKPAMVRVCHQGQWVQVVKPQLDIDGNVIPDLW